VSLSNYYIPYDFTTQRNDIFSLLLIKYFRIVIKQARRGSKVHYSHERISPANDITDLHMLFLNEDRITG